MFRVSHHVAVEHPRYNEYVDLFTNAAKPECHGCSYLINFTTSYALEMMSKVAVLDAAGEHIVRLDTTHEPAYLDEARGRFQAEVLGCEGPSVVDFDVAEVAESMRQWSHFFSPAFIENYKATRLPLDESCGLIDHDGY